MGLVRLPNVRIVLQLARENDLPPIAMSVGQSLPETERGDFVSDEAIQAFWAKYGL
jgi:hypothetical protein